MTDYKIHGEVWRSYSGDELKIKQLEDRVAELEAENERLTAELENEKGEYAELYQSTAEYQIELTEKITRLTAKNKALRKVFDATWDALDGLYGADMGEVIPVTLLPENRQRLFNRVLEVVGETGVMEMLEEH